MSTSSNEDNVDVYELNALGPYNHGTWSGNGRTLGAEEALEGRAGHIVGMFVSGIKKHYSAEQLAEMTMVDVGCYDGFLSVEIEKQVRLKKITAVEPRRKNIRKGEIARRFCGPPLREFLREIGAKSRKSPQFRPSSLPSRNY